ncbi:MAG: OmpA family protein [Acidobacteriota bacterium]|nr:OmpA family protein [Acidobacteriota bacterium]
MTKYGFGISMAVAAFAVAGVTGCATKNYVRQQTAPIIQHTGQLEDQTAQNTRSIQDTDQRAQSGIKQAQSAADAASQNAQSANTAAGNATTAANDAVHRASRLDDVVQGLDKYKQVADVTVTFGFDKSTLTADDKEQLDQFAGQLASAQHYILQVTGGTDSTGPKQYNYDLSQRRADAVVQYLAAKYNIAPHRFYLIGIGEDKEVADNSTRAGRAKNRRVEVQLLTNMAGQDATAPAASNGAGN